MLTQSRFLRSAQAAVCLAALFGADDADAKRTGQNLACHNCHEGQRKPQIDVMFDNLQPAPGATVTITVTAHHDIAIVGGVMVNAHGSGEFQLVTPDTTRIWPEGMVSHSQVQYYMNQQVQWSFLWTAPSEVGITEFEIWSNAGNDNLMPIDDAAGELLTAIAHGCDGVWYYPDGDGDGFGKEDAGQLSCEVIPGMVTQGGDCADDEPTVNPGAEEICNSRDDNCDGALDEGFMPGVHFTDADGDGYGFLSGATQFGCGPFPGFAPNSDDCNDSRPDVNPGAIETSNGIDDNCNGLTDEAPTTTTMPTTTPTTGEMNAPGSATGCAISTVSVGSAGWALGVLSPMLVWASRRLVRRSRRRYS